MSTFAVTVEQIEALHPIEGADRIELAQIGLYRSVVGKGTYSVGDLCVYIPEAAILPDALIEELGLVGKLAGSGKNRVKPVKLRGVLSQGIVCRPKVLCAAEVFLPAYVGIDFADSLGITKWVPEVPVHMAGDVYPYTGFLKWCDIENIKKFPTVFEPREQVIVTEKLHGTCFVSTYETATQTLHVSSKGMAGKQLALQESETNVYWRTAHEYRVKEAAEAIACSLKELYGMDLSHVAIYGEVYGKGIQDLHYGTNKPEFAVFDVQVRDVDGDTAWLPTEDVQVACSVAKLPHVPVLYQGRFDMDEIWEYTYGKETVSGKNSNIREGVVVRSVPERESGVLGGRAIAKFVSDDYLTRKSGTEYE